jgi:peptide/nickel transport system substrate-binding protein
MWQEAQIKILEDMVAYPLQYQNQVTARRDYVDFGHDLKSVLALYAQFTENTTINK